MKAQVFAVLAFSACSAPELLATWMGDPAQDEYLNDVPRHLAKLEQDAEAIRQRLTARPDEDAVRALAGERVTIALVPAFGGWEVPALLAWSGAERDQIGGPEHLSVLHFWNDVYGAELVALGPARSSAATCPSWAHGPSSPITSPSSATSWRSTTCATSSDPV